jgi:YgiT-type zinc finger domain-containing protein
MSMTTDLPFKLREGSIVIIRGLPVLQCGKCPEYLLEDHVMVQVEELLKSVREGTALEIVHFAA